MPDGAGPPGIRPPAPAPAAAAVARGGGRRWRPHWQRPHWQPRAELWRFLELFALCGFVIVQPLLDVIGGSPDFFIFHGVSGVQAMLLVALFVLVPPVGLWAAGVLVGLAGGPRARRAAHLALVAGLFVLFLVQLGKHLTGLRGGWLVALAVLLAAVVAVGYARLDAARQLLRFAAVGPLVFVLLFVFVSPASAVVLAADRPGAGGVPTETGPHPPIVMIVLDEFAMLSLLDRSGQVDAERFPNIARLAGDATWYRNATGTSGFTPYAIPSMLRGQWPAEDAAPHYAAYPDNLFTLLGNYYRISASESITELCPPWYCGDQTDRSRGGFPVALTESAGLLRELMSPVDSARNPYDDYAEPTVAERLDAMEAARRQDPGAGIGPGMAANQPVRFHDFLTALQESGPAVAGVGAGVAPASAPVATGSREFHFLHLLLPHTPWRYLPDGTRYPGGYVLPVDGPWWGRLALQRYLLQLQYTDALIGQTLDVLQATGRYDESLVVLTADHGVSLTPDGAGSRELGTQAPGIVELAWVPMFLKAPGQTEGEVADGNWQHVDLLPTIADYAGVAVPWEVDGISWRQEQRTDPEKRFYPELDQPGTLDGAAGLARILADPTAIPLVAEPPLPELVGTAVADHPVVDGGVRAELAEPDAYRDVDPASGVVPALVYGTVPDQVPPDTPLAIAVNGRIAAVVPVVADGDEGHRFAGLVEDPSRFVAGENRLELFLVPDGTTLHRI